MPVTVTVTVPRGPQPDTDDGLQQVIRALDNYAADHPPVSIDVYRYGQYLIRARVVSDAFRGLSRTERHNRVWKYLEELPEEVLSDVYALLLLTPDEKGASWASMEFDDPTPARL